MQLTYEHPTAMNETRLNVLLSLIILAVGFWGGLKRVSFDYRKVPFAFEKDRGSNVVPGEVNEMKKIVQRRKDLAYSLSAELRSDALIDQRSTEFLYPVRIEQGHTLIFTRHGALAGCSLIDKETAIFLHDCPNPS